MRGAARPALRLAASAMQAGGPALQAAEQAAAGPSAAEGAAGPAARLSRPALPPGSGPQRLAALPSLPPAAREAMQLRPMSTQAAAGPEGQALALKARADETLDATLRRPNGSRHDRDSYEQARAQFVATFHALQNQPPAASPAGAQALAHVKGLHDAFANAEFAFEHLALEGRPLTPMDLAEHLGLDLRRLEPVPGASLDATIMLNILSVSPHVDEEARASGTGMQRLFALTNAQARLASPALDAVTAAMTSAHLEALRCLPPVPPGTEMRRGMDLPPEELAAMAEHFAAARASGRPVVLRGHCTGSRSEGGECGAYPGNVQMALVAGPASRIRNTEAFNHQPLQRELKSLPDITVQVVDIERVGPGETSRLALTPIDPAAIASSGRRPGHAAGREQLVLLLQEVPHHEGETP